MTNTSKYYIWLTQALGYSNPKFKRIHELYASVEDFYLGGEREWRLSGLFDEKEIFALSSTDLSVSYPIIDRCTRSGITVFSFDDDAYPALLYEIYDPPAVLYVKGRLPDFDKRLSIAFVGTRSATSYGKKISHVLAGSLSKVGVVIVSGGAMGVDSAAHTGALEAGGVTVCVLGCGINHKYLMHSAPMRESISKTGAVVSEYPPDFPAAKFTFPERNRIISGLSRGVVVVEAGEKSGSLITASRAVEQGRDVFAVMGNITSPYSLGCNRLIRDGAVPVLDYTDVVNAYPAFSIEAQASSVVENPTHKQNIGVSDDAKKVYYILSAEPMHIDAVTEKAALPAGRVLSALTELELETLVSCDPGRMCRII